MIINVFFMKNLQIQALINVLNDNDLKVKLINFEKSEIESIISNKFKVPEERFINMLKEQIATTYFNNK